MDAIPESCAYGSWEVVTEALPRNDAVSMTAELPAEVHAAEIVALVGRADVGLVLGETGCGKSTVVPKIVVEHYQPMLMMVPRVEVALQLGRTLKNACGARFNVTVATGTFKDDHARFGDLVVATPGVAMQWITRKQVDMSSVKCIVLDEDPEMTELTETMFALLIATYAGKLIILSATADEANIRRCCGSKRVETLRLAGRQHLLHEFMLTPSRQLTDGELELWLRDLCESERKRNLGALLVFLDGRDRILNLRRLLECLSDWKVCSLFADASERDVADAFDARTWRRIVLSTDVAEVGATVPRVGIVINLCRCKRQRRDDSNVPEIRTVPCDRRSLHQRAGRAGREGEGRCLHVRDNAEELPDRPEPAMLHASMFYVLLPLQRLGLRAEDLMWLNTPRWHLVCMVESAMAAYGWDFSPGAPVDPVLDALSFSHLEMPLLRFLELGLRTDIWKEIVNVAAVLALLRDRRSALTVLQRKTVRAVAMESEATTSQQEGELAHTAAGQDMMLSGDATAGTFNEDAAAGQDATAGTCTEDAAAGQESGAGEEATDDLQKLISFALDDEWPQSVWWKAYEVMAAVKKAWAALPQDDVAMEGRSESCLPSRVLQLLVQADLSALVFSVGSQHIGLAGERRKIQQAKVPSSQDGLVLVFASCLQWAPKHAVCIGTSHVRAEGSIAVLSDSLLQYVKSALLQSVLRRIGWRSIHFEFRCGAVLADLVEMVRALPSPVSVLTLVISGNDYVDGMPRYLEADMADLANAVAGKAEKVLFVLPSSFSCWNDEYESAAMFARTRFAEMGFCAIDGNDEVRDLAYKRDGLHPEEWMSAKLALAVARWSRGASSFDPALLAKYSHLVEPPRRALSMDWRPTVIFHTYFADLPQKVYENREVYARGFRVDVFKDSDCRAFLQTNFGERHVARFDAFWCGAHKADFFRYCILWLFGEVYVDVKSALMADLGSFLADKAGAVVSARAAGCLRSHQGVIACPPRHSLLGEAMEHALLISDEEVDNKYMVFCQFFWDALARMHGRTPKTGWNWSEPAAYFMVEEKRWPLLPSCNGEVVQCDGHYLLSGGAPVFATRWCDYVHGRGFDVVEFPPGSWSASARYPKWLGDGSFGALLRTSQGRYQRAKVRVWPGKSYANRNGKFVDENEWLHEQRCGHAGDIEEDDTAAGQDMEEDEEDDTAAGQDDEEDDTAAGQDMDAARIDDARKQETETSSSSKKRIFMNQEEVMEFAAERLGKRQAEEVGLEEPEAKVSASSTLRVADRVRQREQQGVSSVTVSGSDAAPHQHRETRVAERNAGVDASQTGSQEAQLSGHDEQWTETGSCSWRSRDNWHARGETSRRWSDSQADDQQSQARGSAMPSCPAMFGPEDCRFEKAKSDRAYCCDECWWPQRYKKRAVYWRSQVRRFEFDGQYLDPEALNFRARGLEEKDREGMWRRGEINCTWVCTPCRASSWFRVAKDKVSEDQMNEVREWLGIFMIGDRKLPRSRSWAR